MTAAARVKIRHDPAGALIAVFDDQRESIRGRDAEDMLTALDLAGVPREVVVVESPAHDSSNSGLSPEQYARLRYCMGHFNAPVRTEADLIDRYPALLSALHAPREDQWWVPPRLLPVLEAVCDQLQADADAKHAPPPRIVEIKLKHGELRIRLQGGADARQQGMLALAGRMSTLLEADRIPA